MQSAVARGARRQAAATVHPTIGSRLPRWFSASGPAREDGVDELTAPVCEPGRIAARRAMAKRQLHLADPQAGPGRVDRHAQLAAEAARKRKARGARPLAQIALPGQRLPQAKP